MHIAMLLTGLSGRFASRGPPQRSNSSQTPRELSPHCLYPILDVLAWFRTVFELFNVDFDQHVDEITIPFGVSALNSKLQAANLGFKTTKTAPILLK